MLIEVKLSDLLDELSNVKKQLKNLLEVKKEIEMAIIEKCKDYDCAFDEDGVIKATYKPVVITRFDVSAFKVNHKNLYKEYLIKSESRRLLIK